MSAHLDIESRICARLDAIAQRSWIDRAAMAILCTIGAAAVIGLATTVISLRVSYTELSGSIDRLADSVKADGRFAESRAMSMVEDIARLESQLGAHLLRIRELERRRPARAPATPRP